jgi:hypothetical protein
MFGPLVAVAAKLTSVGAATQAAAGLGIALASLTGAGALGVLPAPVQDRVSGVVEAVTPFDLPDSADASSATEQPTTVVVEAPSGEAITDPGGAAQEPPTPETPEQADFGMSVREDAIDGGLDADRSVSTEARDTHQTVTPGAPTTVPAPATPERPEAGQPETVPPSAPGAPAAERVPDEAGRP